MLSLLAQVSAESPWEQWQVQVAVIGAIITALLAVVQALAGLVQRRHEMRTRQAETGRELVEEMLDQAGDALSMLDFDSNQYELDNGKLETITSTDVEESLRQPVERQDPIAIFVRESFDALFYYFEHFEHYIRVRLTRFEDLQAPAEYYVAYMAEDRELYSKYLNTTMFKRAARFLNRFEIWTSAVPVAAQEKRRIPNPRRARPSGKVTARKAAS
jgi:hypothetical protein